VLGPEGAAVYAAAASGRSVTVELLVAAGPEALARLWRHVLDRERSPRAVVRAAGRPPDEPLAFLLANARDVRAERRDGLWLRVVDVPAALAGRAYAAAGRLVLEVEDARCPWNAGRFALAAGPDGADCRPCDAPADVRLEAGALASAYLGGHRWPELAAAGWARELRPGAVALAAALFAPAVEPWCPRAAVPAAGRG
jgi:predicted acetyltransferase